MEKIKKTEEEWRKELTSDQFQVCRKQATERPFTGEFNNFKDPGTYVCVCCGNPLFKSTTKFDSGCGWPSFFKAISEEAIDEKSDGTLGMVRTEVICSKCDAHLGHVFEDGPQPTGLRYCMNSIAMDHIPEDKK